MSDAAHNPTAVRRELGQRLRALRQGRELTLVQAAEQVGFSSSRITKIELAQLKVSQKDVLTMLEVYGETDPEQQALLLSMAREGNHQGVFHDGSTSITRPAASDATSRSAGRTTGRSGLIRQQSRMLPPTWDPARAADRARRDAGGGGRRADRHLGGGASRARRWHGAATFPRGGQARSNSPARAPSRKQAHSCGV